MAQEIDLLASMKPVIPPRRTSIAFTASIQALEISVYVMSLFLNYSLVLVFLSRPICCKEKYLNNDLNGFCYPSHHPFSPQCCV